jgi:hypothetical protein
MPYLLEPQWLLFFAYLEHGSDEFVAPGHTSVINGYLNDT